MTEPFRIVESGLHALVERTRCLLIGFTHLTKIDLWDFDRACQLRILTGFASFDSLHLAAHDALVLVLLPELLAQFIVAEGIQL